MNAMIGSSLLLADEGYRISRSVRLRSSASAYLTRTPSVAGNRQKWTYSTWFKRGTLGSDGALLATPTIGGVSYDALYFNSSNQFRYVTTDNGSTVNTDLLTTQVFRDPSAWYHIVIAVDTTQATASNRIKIYINGSQVTTFSTSTYPPQNRNTNILSTTAMDIGRWATSSYYDGYCAENNLIDGQQLDASSFGETNPATGVWQPKKYTGTYGTQGSYINFSDNSAATAAAIGKDSSGNGNNWTPNNISVTAGVTYDSMLDVPTQWADGGNGRGNYATLNPLTGGSSTTSDGNLAATIAPVNGARVSTIAVTSGKWYCEMVATTVAGYFVMGIGAPYSKGWDTTQESNPNSITWATSGAGSPYVQSKGSWTFSSNTISTTYAANDVVGIALDLDNNTLAFYKNGVSQGSMTINTQGTPVSFLIGNSSGASNGAGYANFGQRPFAYTPPSGFKALNTLNLPTPTILKGNQYFDATLWDGNSTNARVITTNVGTVDFAWVKKRNGADDHRLANTVTGGNRHLQSNTTAAESTGTTVIQAFSGSTFTLGTDNSVNATGGTYVGWTWAEGATQGFDIVTYTGTGANRTVAHNLGVAPSFMIVKARSSAGYDWRCYHSALGATRYIDLQSTAASALASTVWQDTAPTSSVFSVGTNGSVNANTVTFVAYLFSQIAGFSAFGSYTGNGSTDGTFVFTGFRPAFILVKASSNSTASTVWTIWDTRRSPSNAAVLELFPNSSSAENTDTNGIDILSNGFKPRRNSEYANFSGWTYIYAAFAENPLKFSLAR